MRQLTLHGSATLLQVADNGADTRPFLEQVEEYLGRSPVLVLDLGQMLLGSIQIGELVNVHNAFAGIWGERAQRIQLVNVSEQGRKTLLTAGLDKLFLIREDVGAVLGGAGPAGR